MTGQTYAINSNERPTLPSIHDFDQGILNLKQSSAQAGVSNEQYARFLRERAAAVTVTEQESRKTQESLLPLTPPANLSRQLPSPPATPPPTPPVRRIPILRMPPTKFRLEACSMEEATALYVVPPEHGADQVFENAAAEIKKHADPKFASTKPGGYIAFGKDVIAHFKSNPGKGTRVHPYRIVAWTTYIPSSTATKASEGGGVGPIRSKPSYKNRENFPISFGRVQNVPTRSKSS